MVSLLKHYNRSMKAICILYALTGLCVIALSCKKESDPAHRNITLFFLGDSNFKGYFLSDTTERLTTRLSVMLNANEVNQAVSGITMQDGIPKASGGSYMNRLTILPKCAKQGNNYVIIMLGTNDVRIGPDYTPPLYSIALNILLDTLIDDNGFAPSVIFLSTPPVITNYGTGNHEKLLQYNDTIQAVARRRGCVFINLYDKLSQDSSENLLFDDGIHLNELGHQRSADIFFSSFR